MLFLIEELKKIVLEFLKSIHKRIVFLANERLIYSRDVKGLIFKLFKFLKTNSCYMVEYGSDEVNVLIKMLKKVKTKDGKKKEAVAKMINYLNQRHIFFNPTENMLDYIIEYGNKLGLDPALLAKMKEHLSSGIYRKHGKH
jgi:hypothetical protein